MIDTKFFEEVFKTAKTFNEFFLTLTNPRTYFKEISEEELDEFYKKSSKLFFELNKAYWGFLFDLTTAFAKRNGEEISRAINNAMIRIEEIYADYMDNAVVSACVNAINSAYMRILLNLQNFTSAILHSLGMVSRRDVIALSEAYVDLKGDIKKESRKILEEIRDLKERVEKIEKAKKGGSDDQ
ncbi:MAG: hypothetical protein N3D09_04430 [Archaeoglobaceae archaeon]|nr:hypothetical protein [Archaeoglobaceae archaeon]